MPAFLAATARAAQARVMAGAVVGAGWQGPWSALVHYAQGAIVVGSDGHVYTSKAGANLNHDPAGAGAAFWEALAA